MTCQHRIEWDRNHTYAQIEGCNCAELQQRIAELEGVLGGDASFYLTLAKENAALTTQLAAAREAVEMMPHDSLCQVRRHCTLYPNCECCQCGCHIGVAKAQTLALLKGE